MDLNSKIRFAIRLYTTLFVYDYLECDAFLPSEDGCAAITASVKLQFQPDDTSDPIAITEEYKDAADGAIDRGDLQDNLDTLYPDTVVYIIDSIGPDPDPTGGINSGGIVGIVIASVAFTLLFIAYVVSTRRSEPKDELEPLDPAPREPLSFEDTELEGSRRPSRSKKKHKDKEMLGPLSAVIADHDSDAGDSGWSSSAGVSSINTGDQMGSTGDDPDDAGGASQSQTNTADTGSQQQEASQSVGGVTRADLDMAIEAGDWAAVGATAALLAAASDTNSFSSRSITAGGTSTRDGSTVSSHDAARAAELDHLVDAGDWEGVVLAAARFEAASTVNSDSASRQSQSKESNSLGTDASPVKTRKNEEWRAEVEDLVQKVVPEEIQNVDEMMLQFQGREEELIETLRTMQERQIAQRARLGAQKAAKAEAKRSQKEKRNFFGFGKRTESDQVSASAKSLGTGAVRPAAKSLGSGLVSKPQSSREKKQSKLEKAIESGDWEAVGEAAAMLNDASSASSADTEEINRLADGLSSTGSQTPDDPSNKRAARAEELDALIDSGDWKGVVQAAEGYEKEEGKSSKSFPIAKKKRKEKRSKRLEEEQEALEQAEIWMAIAERSKEGGEKQDEGAREAADWAIERSLAALVDAEGTDDAAGDK